jgi:hypothetical protein
LKRRGRKSAAQTPAPKKEQVYGSSKNPVGSAASKTSASKIQLSDSIVKTLEDKRNDFNDNHPTKKVSLATLKAVMRRGMGAYSTSHRPTITGGAPNSRQAWGFARVNKFLKKYAGQTVKAAYVQDDDLMAKGGLIATNGKPSNLTAEQYKLVRTPEFKAWFGDWENDPKNASKVVDENGEPLVVYHGSRENFNEFKKDKIGSASPLKDKIGFFFTNNIIEAKEYGDIKKYFLSIRNPFVDDTNDKYSTSAIYYWDMRKNDYLQKSVNNDGFIIYSSASNMYVAIEPNQIKLADGSNTTFDANNPDIRYEEGGDLGQEITCVRCGWHWNTADSDESDKYVCHKCGFDNRTYYDSDPIGTMKKKIALPDTYSSYESLKSILAKQGYAINKIDMEIPVGKLAKGMSLSEVAAIHKLKAEDLKSELKIGIETEMEHTDRPEYARAIALDHLYEDPKYYTKLKKMEGIDSHYNEIRKKYADGGSIDPIFSFKTPTGEASRLTYLQQVLVRTKGFKEFFGDWEYAAKSFLIDGKNNFEKHYKNVSKVIDYVTLEPRVVFHGTRAQDEFFRFDVTKEKGVGRPYGYFAHNKEYSQNFTQFSQRTTRETKPFMYECFINIRNPFYATTMEYWQKNRDADGWKTIITGTISYDKYKTIERNEVTREIEENVESQVGDYINKVFADRKAPFWSLMAADAEKDFKFFIMAYGYDGIFYGEEIGSMYDPENPAQYTQAVTIFDSKQVKLADGRNLNFNPLLDDIRYEEGGYMPESEETPNIPIMNKKAKLGMLITGGKYEVGGTVVTEHGSTNDAKKGGYFHGRSHADGGIKAINKDTGQMIEVEGEEVIITKGAVNDETKREFEGKMMTNREILSRINQSGGGVAFEDGGAVKGHTCGCSGKKYKFGGQMLEDFHIIRYMNDPQKLSNYTVKNSREFADSLVSKLK